MNQLGFNRMSGFDAASSHSGSVSRQSRRRIGKAIWDRKWILLACLVAGAFIGEIIYRFSTPTYVATDVLKIDQPGDSYGEQDMGKSGNSLYALANSVKDPDVIMLARKNLRGLKTFSPSAAPAKTINKNLPHPTVATTLPDDPAADTVITHILERDLSTSVGRRPHTIEISFSSPYPEDTVKVVKEMVAAFRLTHLAPAASATGPAQNPTDALTRQRQELAAAEKAVGDFQLANRMALLDPANVVNETKRKETLEDDLAKAQNTTAARKLEYDNAVQMFIPESQRQALSETGTLPDVMVPPGVDPQQMRARLDEDLASLARLKERYMANHPAMQEAQQKVNQAASQLVLMLHQQWVLAKNTEDRANAAMLKQQTVLDDLNSRIATLQKLQSDVNAKRDMLATLEKEQSAHPVIAVQYPTDIKVYTEATVPTEPSSPRHGHLLFWWSAGGLVLGLLLSLVDTRLRSVTEATAATGLPVLGTVPAMGGRNSLLSRGRKVHLDPTSDTAEAFRMLRTTLFFGSGDLPLRTILVTSASHADGKSTVAANLAIAMAESAQRVLLIDADLRRPMLHRIFSATAERGVSTVISGRSTLERAIQPTAIKNLDLLPCGPLPLNPAETINNQAFADMLDVVAQRYDRVVLDAPPVMAVTDARILSATCDATVLVLRARRTTRQASNDARDGLLGFGARILGTILNGYSRHPSRYGYHGGAPGLRRAESPREVSRALAGSDIMVPAKR